MKYFFILGNNTTLSLAELSAVFGFDDNSKTEIINPEIFLLETENNFDPAELIKKLGGVIKIGIISNEFNFDNQKIIAEAEKLIDTNYHGKIKFGISHYGNKQLNLKVIGMEVKKCLREKNISIRWVTSKEKILSSVVVEQNKLISQGAEIILIQKDNHVLIGKTLAVQPFKELSFRDYGRPARDDLSGMLPPKLAQIMINLAVPPLLARRGAGGEVIILDPFCGSGTILTEAMLMGYKNLIGSDISPKAVEDTEKNTAWVKSKFQVTNYKLQLHNKNAEELSKFIAPQSIDAIITEPYLGPQRGRVDIKKIVPELEQLYSNTISEFKKILKPNGRVIMIWPEFHISHIAQRITPNIDNFKIINPVPKKFWRNKGIILTDRNTIVYGRPDQKVWREIVILEK
ncbi:MAG: methyltransferase domain-containing protein [Patescibacteria group bacterium]|nr:methyltransferase domain-containing protein [Patescibacteria group bacterium]MDD5294355.1 methyltransferase domain-containing protein [Patescibacteria group bacterium]MDD5554028.1 methyltransferase domain-containing protein [Patescibacteria group bacterium]